MTLTVEHWPTTRLVPYARNPRTHSDDQVDEIGASIESFGWTNPVLVDETNGIIAGHGRLLAAQKLGMKEVPVIELAGLSEEQKRALIIADNKLAPLRGFWSGLPSRTDSMRTQPCCLSLVLICIHAPWRVTISTRVFSGSVTTVTASRKGLSFSSVALRV